MISIEKKSIPSETEILEFLKSINFDLPIGFLEFWKKSNGCKLEGDEIYVHLWSFSEILERNKTYEEFMSEIEFYVFGSDGGGTAFCIERETGFIFNMPFIVMGREDAVFMCQTFDEFLEIFD